ncbi:hypothetical protein HRR83_005310 [Exophiala dermatitidis]|uniref:non-specific serine/threonine protein kinase n=3 Tax=Exophiala dermatitidis TaxID=5970 RepID=H6C1Q0_EXODN|nr:uncharacterized protein HMPREF1120_05803 [Exophiala dermatitidis NIH/UT8656]KAJ4512968.1 hypothetical protein HRR75_004735 [Exophiala dermatitidis]EHY57779.1 hypothetical protein HMPREF1120_05803 [Exophiala dermatitidis NIH/UT8656]KAJ4516006.1 hypothetical protein HRR74_005163 [Exophiala dermatitidis]KAJ4518589.1 hypothetical protein HRR73_004170 [Exophiala dermatitidis]KAJ4554411.1 hypothetical protein HRR78_002815 [Exophiala dermatitidis]
MHLPVSINEQPVHERAPWTRDKAKVQRRLARWRKKRWYDDNAERFGLSKAWFDDHEDQWECTELLGKGSFGVVGQWTKFDKHGRAVDTIAIKQTDIDEREVDRNNNVTIPWEVLIMRGLADQGCRNVAGIRKYKLFLGGSRARWRYYLEYHRHGTLDDLVERYKDHNRRHPRHRDHIPETFMWQAFHDFALAAYHMSTIRFDKSVAPPGDDHFVLHLDLKHENVLLCEPPTSRNSLPYPTLKVGDWGMAEYTSRQDVNNSKRWKCYGTICWFPPEQRKYGAYGSDWTYPILGGPDHPFTISHTIWQMAANIYGMMQLDMDNQDLHTRINDWESAETSLRHNGYSVLRGWKNPHYTSTLRHLVEDCLNVDPTRRPTPVDLVRSTKKGVDAWVDEYRRKGKVEKLRLG